ncbi:hypothetical protein LSTR_LSTR015247, partial [Laodelphax striatellus]
MPTETAASCPSVDSGEESDFWPNIGADLAAIRKLLECESTGGNCPSCKMPFDKGKKRKLIDTCGHERCYSCMFRNEACPLCQGLDDDAILPAKKVSGSSSLSDNFMSDSRGTLTSRPQVKTNGHFTAYMQTRQNNGHDWGSTSPCRLPRPGKGDMCCYSSNPMSQSCPTPPQNRKKFFLSPKSLRSSWGLRGNSRVPADNALSDDEGGTIRPVISQPPKKSSQSDLYMRLGLLLGDNARRGQPHHRSRDSRASRSHDSISSLASFEANTLASTNTSPVSTLT